jgi:hypothetical protein
VRGGGSSWRVTSLQTPSRSGSPSSTHPLWGQIGRIIRLYRHGTVLWMC